MRTLRQLIDQPKAVFLLAFVEMWNRFSQYGMRALLVLYMINVLNFSEAASFGVYAIFCAGVEFSGVFGVYLADKILGLRRSIVLGGWIIAAGHLTLVMKWFFPGLALLIIGSSLVSTNITVLMGNFYTVNDERRTSGFTLFYMGLNFGALLATLLCGFLAEDYGWGLAFGLAAVGAVISNFVLIKYSHLLEGKGELAVKLPRKHTALIFPILIGAGCLACLSLSAQHHALPLLPLIAFGAAFMLFRSLQKKGLNSSQLGLALLSLILFFAAEEQIGSSLLVFTDQMMTHSLFGIQVPPSLILALNPLVVILFVTIAGSLQRRMRYPFLRVLSPFIFAAGAFASLALGNIFLSNLPISTMMTIVGVISFAELMIGPIAYSICSEISTQAKDPKVMGLVPIGFSLASMMGGGMSKLIAQTSYDTGFLFVSAFLLLVGLIVAAVQNRLQGKPLID